MAPHVLGDEEAWTRMHGKLLVTVVLLAGLAGAGALGIAPAPADAQEDGIPCTIHRPRLIEPLESWVSEGEETARDLCDEIPDPSR